MILSILLVFLMECHAQAESVNQAFEAGLKHYTSSQFDEAEKSFQEALAYRPDNASVLFNLGLAEQKLGHSGKALAYWRRAISLDPTLTEARAAINFVFEKLPQKELPHEVTLWERFKLGVLDYVDSDWILLIFSIALLISGRLLAQFLGRRRQALANEEKIPALTVTQIFSYLCFSIAAFLLLAKIYDYMNPRATVIVAKVEAKTSPSPESAALFELFEGLPVIVRKLNEDWAQVTYPGGRTGWVPKDSLIQTAGQKLW